jgi:CRP-like cAMP-binding protein
MLTDESLASALAQIGEPMLVPKAAMLFDVGEPCTGVYVVQSGAVDLHLLADGQPIWSRYVPEHGIIGLPAAVGKQPYSLRAVANDHAQLVFVRAEAVQDAIRNDATIGMQILRVMSEEVTALRRKFSMFKA